MPSDDDRYHDLLKLFGDLNREFQAFKVDRAHSTEILRDEVLREIRTYWAATAAGLRQLSDWFAETEDAARRERAEAQAERLHERAKRSVRDWIVIVLLAVLIVLVLSGLTYLIGRAR